MYSCGPPHMDVQKQDDQHERTYSNYVRTQDVTLKTCRRWWMIGGSGERGISLMAARHDDDEIKTSNEKVWVWLIDFNEMSIRFGILYAYTLDNPVYIVRLYERFLKLFLKRFLHADILYQVFQSNTNYLHIGVWFQVFPSNTNNYMISNNHFYSIIVICFPTVIWCQATDNYVQF